MPKVPIKPQTYGRLVAESRPSLPGQPETIPWVFYDSQEFISGTTTQLRFFSVTATDRSISNMVNAGQIPDPQFFTWYYWGCDVLLRPSSTVVANSNLGAIDDIAQLTLSGRGTATFTLSDKVYGPFPLSFLHTSGGPLGFGWGSFPGGAVPGESAQYANNGVMDGGYAWNGAILISPKEGFFIDLNWPAALTLDAGNTFLRVWMYGQLSRKVQ